MTIKTLITISVVDMFGDTLVSRLQGKKDFTSLQLYLLTGDSDVVFTLNGAKILTPSYLDETVIKLISMYGGRVLVDKKTDDFIKESLEYLSERKGIEIPYK